MGRKVPEASLWLVLTINLGVGRWYINTSVTQISQEDHLYKASSAVWHTICTYAILSSWTQQKYPRPWSDPKHEFRVEDREIKTVKELMGPLQ